MTASPPSASGSDSAGSNVRIKLVKSPIGFDERQKATVRSLGLRRLQQEVVLVDSPAVRGMVFAVQHLVKVEETDDTPTSVGGWSKRGPRQRAARRLGDEGLSSGVPDAGAPPAGEVR